MVRSLKVNKRTLSLIQELLRGSTEPLEQYDPRVARAMAFLVSQTQQTGIKLQDIATQSCLSVPHLCRLFSKEVGLSPVRFLALLRVEKSKFVLADHQCLVKHAWGASGFGDISTFERQFKRWTGCTPKRYRKKVLARAKRSQKTKQKT